MTVTQNWKPTLVKECADPDIQKNRLTLDWSSKEIQEWKSNAIKMQEAHAKDNSRTKWFAYLPEERDAIELRILIALYGMRIPQDKTKPPPSCPLKVYTHEERLHARKVKKTVVKQSKNAEKIYFNVIYISVATLDDDNKIIATEEPVFIVKGSERPVDRDGRGYSSMNSYRQDNNLPRGGAIFPANGSYTTNDNNGNDDDRIPLIAEETPNASWDSRAKAVTDTVAMVGGIALTVTGLILCAPAGIFSAAAMSAISTGSFYAGTALTIYSVGSASVSIFNKMNDDAGNDQSIRTELFTIATALLSAYTQRLSGAMAAGARQGKTLTQTIEGLTKLEQKIFPLLNYIKFITLFTGVSGLFSAAWELLTKKDRSWFDYFQFSMLLFMTANTLAKPWTLKEIFESEQIKCLDEMRKSLNKDESKTEFDKMQEAHDTSDKKAYMIRNLNQIDKKNEFFELINKTGSIVKCTPDGLVINNKIDIHPKAYNAIGNYVILSKLEQTQKYCEASFKNSIQKEFANIIPDDQMDGFKKDLQKISGLPIDERKAATKALIEKCGANTENFDSKWNSADGAFNKDMNEQTSKMIDNMKTGITDKSKLDDFKKLEELSQKQSKGVILNDGEKANYNDLVDKCSTHRKEQFFQTSADYRRITDEFESVMSGGKNVEQWKYDLRQLERDKQTGSISGDAYSTKKTKCLQNLQKSEAAREFREKCDAFVLVNDGKSATEFVESYKQQLQSNLNIAKERGEPEAIRAAQNKINAFQNIKNDIQNTQEAIITQSQNHSKEYAKQISTFNNGQSERLCYRIDVERVKYNLQQIYQRPDFENVTVNGNKIFQNMSLGSYDRINRVLKEHNNDTKSALMNAATTLANDSTFNGKVQTPDDMASIMEAMIKQKESLKLKNPQAFYNSLSTGQGEQYENFKTEFNKRIDAVMNLNENLRSQWSSPLSMTYHHWKHQQDFGNTPVTLEEYFGTHANSIFSSSNVDGLVTYSQTGVIRQTYSKSFGKRFHVGFTSGSEESRRSHFIKKDTK